MMPFSYNCSGMIQIALCCVFGALPFDTVLARPVPLRTEDIFRLEFALSPEISPDGEWIVYSRMSSDIMTDRTGAALWVVKSDGSGHRALTEPGSYAGDHVWSPDSSHLAFVSTREGSPELYIYDRDRETITRLTDMKSGFPQSLSWSPDGRQIAFAKRVTLPPPAFAEMPEPPDGAQWAPPPIVIDRLSYRQPNGAVSPNGVYQLYIANVADGSVRQVTGSERSVGRSGEPILWAKDGAHLIAVGFEKANTDRYEWETALYRVTVADGTLTQLTHKPSYEGQAALSPNRSQLAFIGFQENYPRGAMQRQDRLYVMPASGGQPRLLSGGLDRIVTNPRWSADGKSILAMFDDEGVTKLGEFHLDGSHRVVAENLGSFSLAYTIGNHFSVALDGRIAFTFKTAHIPGDVAIVGPGASDVRRVTKLNDDLLAQRDLGEVREIRYRSSRDGLDLQGWYILPPRYDPRKSYPLILEIHGGPYANYGPRFDVEKQIYAAANYVVLYLNQRGSTSYGTPFIKEIYHDYPGKEALDLMDGVRALSEKIKLDTERMFVAGGSGGGVLGGVLIADFPDAFRAAAILYPISEWRSYFYSAAPWVELMQASFATFPWEDDPSYHSRSIVSRADEIRTPTLVMVGENDYQAPVPQSEALYRALRWNGVDSVLVLVPGEGHGIRGRPSHFVAKLEHILGWFRAHD